MREAIEQFREAIRAAGLTPPDEIEADGKLRRFASNGKKGDDAGWYLLHGDGIPAGSFGDWRAGFSQTWRADIGRALTPAEEAEHRAKVSALGLPTTGASRLPRAKSRNVWASTAYRVRRFESVLKRPRDSGAICSMRRFRATWSLSPFQAQQRHKPAVTRV
jgi:putative DNA primase/helicase